MGCSGSREDASKSSSQKKKKGKGKQEGLQDVYQVREKLGQGAFGIVLACRHRKTQDNYAVKMVDKVESPLDEIMKEVKMLQDCDCPNIVKCHDYFDERCFVCIVMDKYDGGNVVNLLQEHLKERGKIPPPTTIRLSVQMLASVRYLHHKSIVHRDIKGDNYLADVPDLAEPEVRLVLTDFGTAEYLYNDDRFSAPVGTKLFWSPEFFRGDYAFKVDCWAVGVTTFGLLEGKFPFRDEQDVLKRKPNIPKTLDDDCIDFVKALLNKEESKRLTADQALAHRWVRDKITIPWLPDQELDDIDEIEIINGTTSRPLDSCGFKSTHSLNVPESPNSRSVSVVSTVTGSTSLTGNQTMGAEFVNAAVEDRRHELIERLQKEGNKQDEEEKDARRSKGSRRRSSLKNLTRMSWGIGGRLSVRSLRSSRGSISTNPDGSQVGQWLTVLTSASVISSSTKGAKVAPAISEASKMVCAADCFTIPDRSDRGNSLFFKWMTLHEVKELGYAKVSGKLCDEPVNKSNEESLKKILVDHGIDVSKFGKGKAKDIATLAGEIERGVSRLMLNAMKFKHLIRVIDVIVIRLYEPRRGTSKVKGRMIVEIGETLPDGRTREFCRLPGGKKEPYESWSQCSVRIVKENIGIPPDKVKFNMEWQDTFEEELESPSFPGLTTLYRKEVITAVIICDEDDPLYTKLNVNAKSGTWVVKNADSGGKTFAWHTEKEAIKKGAKLQADGNEEMSPLVSPPTAISEEGLPKYLVSHGIKPDGQGIQELNKELTGGVSRLEEDASGNLIRVVDQLVLRIQNVATDDVLILNQKITAAGDQVLNCMPKHPLRPNENQFLAAWHFLRRSLGVLDHRVIINNTGVEYYEEEAMASEFPDLRSIYLKRVIPVTLYMGATTPLQEGLLT